MAFELIIAMKRDPSDPMSGLRAHDATPAPAAAPVATFDVSGDFSEAQAQELERRVESVLAGTVDSVVIRFASLDCERPSVLNFSHWLAGMRQSGNDVRIIEGESPVHALLTENDMLPEAAMPLADAEAKTRRRVIDAHH